MAVSSQGYGTRYYYLMTDNIGSIIGIVNDNGEDVFKATYDPWGKQTVIIDSLHFHRGFTGHEMLPRYDLINMNGRLYDPTLGRFLSPDNYVQLPDFSQSFNRYSYCLNNPLKYIDPDGENPIILGAIVGAVVGAYLGGVTSNNGEMNPLSWDYGEPFTYIGVAFGGLAGGIVGSFVGGSTFWGINVSLENKLISIGVSLAPSTGTGLRYGLHWTTHGGGGYDSDIEKAVEKAGRAYDEFVEDYRQHMYEIHTGLDAVGLVPGFDFADLLNSSLYLIEGDYTNAGISALAVVPVLGGFATGGKVASKGYSSYNKFLTKYGKAGNGMEWHHIVEQRKANINQFGPEKIHNIDNMIALPKDVHRKISAHYSKKSPIQPELTVRGWLNGQSYEFQYQYGLDVLKKFGY